MGVNVAAHTRHVFLGSVPRGPERLLYIVHIINSNQGHTFCSVTSY